MRFFIDNCISHRLASGIRAISEIDGHEVIHLQDRWPDERSSDNRREKGVADEVWLLSLSREGGWIVLSGDFRIYKNPQRNKIWRRAGLTTFFLQPAWLDLSYWEQAWRLVRWWPSIAGVARSVERGSGYSVPASPSGKLKQLR